MLCSEQERGYHLLLKSNLPIFFCSNVDLSFQPSPCMFSHQIKLNMAKTGLLILPPKGLSLTFFFECGGKYQHHLLFSPVNSAACLTQPCFRLPHLGQLQILQIPCSYSEIQHLLPCLQLCTVLPLFISCLNCYPFLCP